MPLRWPLCVLYQPTKSTASAKCVRLLQWLPLPRWYSRQVSVFTWVKPYALLLRCSGDTHNIFRRGGLARGRKLDSWYVMAINTGMLVPQRRSASGASLYHPRFSSNKLQILSLFLGGSEVQPASANNASSADNFINVGIVGIDNQ